MPKRKFYVEDNTVKVSPPFTGRERDPLGWGIKKWAFIVRGLEDNEDMLYDGGDVTCALCTGAGRYSCGGCVAKEKAGGCSKPYNAWGDACVLNDHAAALSAARDIVAFLEGLRDD